MTHSHWISNLYLHGELSRTALFCCLKKKIHLYLSGKWNLICVWDCVPGLVMMINQLKFQAGWWCSKHQVHLEVGGCVLGGGLHLPGPSSCRNSTLRSSRAPGEGRQWCQWAAEATLESKWNSHSDCPLSRCIGLGKSAGPLWPLIFLPGKWT